mmetsp:Transcript_6880/g.14166  ORF Transcript_6880/g.14166 Transcript_6880/m.14166 type:complete len:213 (-) Transcript_6880:346-984(-)
MLTPRLRCSTVVTVLGRSPPAVGSIRLDFHRGSRRLLGGSVSNTRVTATHEVTDEGRDRVVYEGAFGSSLRKVKSLSLVSCGMTCLGSPGLIFLGEGSPTAWAMGGLIMSFGVLTTSALHWFSKPYVLSIRGPWKDSLGVEKMEVEKLNFWARRQVFSLALSEIREPGDTARPLTTVRTIDRGALYIDTELFRDQQLLLRMMPWLEKSSGNE